jgi:hypothetical protein
MSIQEILDKEGSWVFIAPVSSLTLTKAVNFEYRVDKVTFVDGSKLPKIRKRLGLPSTIGGLKKQAPNALSKFVESGQAFACERLTGKGSQRQAEFFRHVRDELALLTLSQLGFCSRQHNANPTLANARPSREIDYLLFNGTMGWGVPFSEWTEKSASLKLDENWRGFHPEVFFFDLLKILTGKIKVENSWRKVLRSAAILAGQSQGSPDLLQSFLWNVIAIEMLLAKQEGEPKVIDSLPERAEAFLGWAVDWKLENYEQRIRNLYAKRNAFVHRGERDAIKREDLLLTDDLLLNVLINIVKHPALFSSNTTLSKLEVS